MFPPFPQEAACHYCQKLISLIEKGDVLLKQSGRVSLERRGQGLMLGALVCWKSNEDGSGQRIVLYAVSGNNKELELADSSKNPFVEKSYFVPSIVSSEKIDLALKEHD